MTVQSTYLIAACCTVSLGSAASAWAGPDAAEAGHALFKSTCATCHSPEPDTNRIGPSLFNVVGRPAGHIEGFAYSDANRRSGIVWDKPTLNRYLTAPQAMVPGTKMTFPGLKDEQQRANIIAYLETLKPGAEAR